MKSTRLNACMFQQVFHQSEFSAGIVITFQVMAFTGMSPGYPDRISALSQARQNELRAHAAGTWNPNDPDIRRVFHPADTGQIGCAVTAPAA